MLMKYRILLNYENVNDEITSETLYKILTLTFFMILSCEDWTLFFIISTIFLFTVGKDAKVLKISNNRSDSRSHIAYNL